MSMTLCVILSIVTIAIGILTLRVGLRSGGMAAKVGIQLDVAVQETLASSSQRSTRSSTRV